LYVPLPILIALAIIVPLLALAAFRRRAARDPLMGAPPASPPRAPSSGTSPPAPAVQHGDLAARVPPLVAAGRKIEAIKLVRDETGMGLKEAKDFADGLE